MTILLSPWYRRFDIIKDLQPDICIFIQNNLMELCSPSRSYNLHGLCYAFGSYHIVLLDATAPGKATTICPVLLLMIPPIPEFHQSWEFMQVNRWRSSSCRYPTCSHIPFMVRWAFDDLKLLSLSIKQKCYVWVTLSGNMFQPFMI